VSCNVDCGPRFPRMLSAGNTESTWLAGLMSSMDGSLGPWLLLGVLLTSVIGCFALAWFLATRSINTSGHKSATSSASQPVIEGVHDGFVLLDEKRRVNEFNSRLAKLMPDQANGAVSGMEARALYEQLCSDNTGALNKLDAWLANLPGDGTAQLELTTCNDQLLLISEKALPDGQVASSVRDISDRRANERALSRALDFDSLTGLPNRASMLTRLREALRQPEQPFALIICDLRDFRQINDSYGQYFADQLLVEVADLLVAAMPANATIARAAGDEFAIIAPLMEGRDALFARAEDFLEQLANGVTVAARSLPIQASMGVSLAPQDGRTVGELKSAADSAVAESKASGTNSIRLYDRSQQQAADRAHQLDIGLGKALERDEFHLQYQPQIDCRSHLTTGMEALLRWHSDSLGPISPAEFVPRAERSDLICDIGEWVLIRAIEDYKTLARYGITPATLSVNLSRRQFRRPDAIERITNIIEHSGIEPNLLTLEITETALLSDRQQAASLLKALSAIGVNLSIDDFGVGYSSFLELRDFPVNEVKIDRAFINDMQTCKQSLEIIKATIAVAEAIGAEVVAEGIENAGQFKMVSELGCHRAQGFFLCEPVRATMFPDVVLGGHDALSDPFDKTLLMDS